MAKKIKRNLWGHPKIGAGVLGTPKIEDMVSLGNLARVSNLWPDPHTIHLTSQQPTVWCFRTTNAPTIHLHVGLLSPTFASIILCMTVISKIQFGATFSSLSCVGSLGLVVIWVLSSNLCKRIKTKIKTKTLSSLIAKLHQKWQGNSTCWRCQVALAYSI